jgi:farnesyl diphosphate synthase
LNPHPVNPALDDYVQRAASALDRFLPRADEKPERLHEAMRYACLNGGKRIRAMLTYSAGITLGGTLTDLDVPASAVEMIHAYSLVHDDLPAMDDDDLRRGRPTCHVAYDEATAILAGDALQTRAFEILASHPGVDGERRLRMISTLAEAAGSRGMVGGQVMDMAGENRALGLGELQTMHRAKTGALITAAVVLGGLAVPGVDEPTLAAYERFGREVGMAFQIVDDVLDETGDTVTLGKRAGADRQAGKSTYPAAIGLDESRRLVREHRERALEALDTVPADTAALRDIATLVVDRSS